MEKSRIRDKHPGSATLVPSYLVRAGVWFGELDGDPAAFRHDALDKLAAGSNNRIVDLRRDGDILNRSQSTTHSIQFLSLFSRKRAVLYSLMSIYTSVADPGSGTFLTPGSGIRNMFFFRIPDPELIFLRAY